MIPLLAIAIMGKMIVQISSVEVSILCTDTAPVSIEGLGKHVYDIDFQHSYTDVFKYCEFLTHNAS